MSTINVRKVSKLANIPLSKEENEVFKKQLSDILVFVEKLNKLSTKSIEPTYQVVGVVNRFREDEEGKCLKLNEATKNAKSVKDNYIVTKGVFDV